MFAGITIVLLGMSFGSYHLTSVLDACSCAFPPVTLLPTPTSLKEGIAYQARCRGRLEERAMDGPRTGPRPVDRRPMALISARSPAA